MLEQPTIEKLLAMRLQGMADALKAQEQDQTVRGPSQLFGDRQSQALPCIVVRDASCHRQTPTGCRRGGRRRGAAAIVTLETADWLETHRAEPTWI